MERFIFALIPTCFLRNQTDPDEERKRKVPGKRRGSEWRIFELNAGEKEEERAYLGALKAENPIQYVALVEEETWRVNRFKLILHRFNQICGFLRQNSRSRTKKNGTVFL